MLVARIGDAHSHGGSITTGSRNVHVAGIPVARLGDQAVCPLQGHNNVTITTGARKTLANGLPVARIGDKLSCGAVIVTGARNVMVVS